MLSRGLVLVLKTLDLSPTQYNVLRILRGTPAGLACGEIAARMITRDPDVTRLLEILRPRVRLPDPEVFLADRNLIGETPRVVPNELRKRVALALERRRAGALCDWLQIASATRQGYRLEGGQTGGASLAKRAVGVKKLPK